jgi:hypothetical protein
MFEEMDMWGRTARALAVAALLATVTTPAVVARPFATLDGRTIATEDVGDLACHDFEYPIIRCFDSVQSLEASVAGELVRRSPGTAAAATLGYVIVYEHAQYGGSNPKVLSTDVPWLSDIGWNDKISSFKSFGASGQFYENSPSGGFAYYYWPTTQVPSLSGTYNDKFSAFYIN